MCWGSGLGIWIEPLFETVTRKEPLAFLRSLVFNVFVSLGDKRRDWRSDVARGSLGSSFDFEPGEPLELPLDHLRSRAGAVGLSVNDRLGIRMIWSSSGELEEER